MEVVELRHRADLVEAVAGLLEDEWPEWYGPEGPGDAASDAAPPDDPTALPVRVVAVDDDGRLAGTAALLASSIATHTHLTPWLGSLVVRAQHRGRGVGTALVSAVERSARQRGHACVHTATATAGGIVTRRGWTVLDPGSERADAPTVYVKDLVEDRVAPRRGVMPWTS